MHEIDQGGADTKAAAKPSATDVVATANEHGAQLRIHVQGARVPPPGNPDVLTRQQKSRAELTAGQRGVREVYRSATKVGLMAVWEQFRELRLRVQRGETVALTKNVTDNVVAYLAPAAVSRSAEPPMKRKSVSEVRKNIKTLIDQGEPILVTYYGAVVACLVPVEQQP